MVQPKNDRATVALRKRRAARVWRQIRRNSWWIITIITLVAQVAFQVGYPSNRTLPLAKYNHEPYGWKSQNELLVAEQTAFISTKIELAASFGSEVFDLIKTGAELNETKNFSTLQYYPKEWRWVPFSIFLYRPEVTTLAISYADQPLREFSETYAKKHSTPPEDAAVTIQEDGTVALKNGKDGIEVDAAALQTAIRKARVDMSGRVRVSIPEKKVPPATTTEDMSVVRERAEEIIAKKITVAVSGSEQTFSPAATDIASWLQITKEDATATIEVSSEKINSYIDKLNTSIAQPAGETVVRIVDGQEVYREEGGSGVQINRDDFVKKMQTTINNPYRYGYVTALLEPVAPKETTAYGYSHSQAGLQAKLNDIGKRYDVRISLQQLDGDKWSASYRGAETTPSASTYKLYIAIRLFHDIAEGRRTWQTPILGLTTEACFEQMIAISVNRCAEEWLRQFGRVSLNNFLYQRGISTATTFTPNGGAVRTSADDLLRVVRGIYDGSLATGHERDTLLSTMARQIWRKGIPAGTKGWASNKVGFLWDYVHDTAVVHHPKGTYVVAIMTKGGSYDIIAKITRELEAQMYP